jgi:hypothetical protein
VYQIGLGVATAMASGGSADPGAAALEGVSDYVTNAARKRYAYLVSPVRVISWDHTKLVGQ